MSPDLVKQGSSVNRQLAMGEDYKQKELARGELIVASGCLARSGSILS